jgi:hypothetical protein
LIKNLELAFAPEIAFDDDKLSKIVRSHLRLAPSDEIEIVKLRRSIDARSRNPVVNYSLCIYTNESPSPESPVSSGFRDVSSSKRVIIVGAGPAGYFAALELIECGLRPIIFDRGKDVRSRRRDLRAIQQFSEVNPDSNYCYGEGGAGTYSDGKLYTRSHKRGDISKALRILVEHGASPDILIDAHPHIGSNKLPVVVQNLRQTIIQCGGEVHFNSLITDLIIDENRCLGVIVNDTDEHLADAVILSTGHSARDIFYLLQSKSIRIECKPFAIGVRAEHPQALIDEIQYRQNPRSEYLPAASYKLATQVFGKGVYSFCMCPGGLIVPAATAPGEIVVNGMSMSGRNSKFANSGIVVSIDDEDLKDFTKHGELRGLEFQKDLERKFFKAGDGSQKAPAQRLTDFVEQKHSSAIGATSYIPGVYGYALNDLLPQQISKCLRIGLKDFGKKMKGYYTEEAYLVGSETRTSSPVRIPRDKESFEHVEIRSLYPCGEGAGYAGGIISAALDGQNTAKAIAKVFAE